MSTNISVNTSSVRSAGTGFDMASSDAIEVLNDAVERLSKYDGVWGKDETGHQFDKVYAPARDGLVKGLEAIPRLLQNYSGGLNSTAAFYDRTEDITDGLVNANQIDGRK